MKKQALFVIPAVAAIAAMSFYTIAVSKENKEVPLSDETIAAYYASADIAQSTSVKALQDWLYKHVDDNADINVSASLNIDHYNIKDRVNESFLDKYLLIEDTKNSSQSSKIIKSLSVISKIEYGEFNKSATINVTTQSTSHSFGNPEKNEPALEIVSNGECTDKLALQNDIVTLMGRTCTIETIADVIPETK